MIPKEFKPMLASPLSNVHALRFPALVSPKLDGVRAIVFGSVVYSRNLKPIPNAYVQATFGRPEFEGFDGELIVGEATAKDVFTRTMSGVMSLFGAPDVKFHIFDRYCALQTYAARRPVFSAHAHAIAVPQYQVETHKQLDNMEQTCVNAGWEGVMVRNIDGHYKCGRSTERQGLLLKLKRFDDSEAVVLGVEELMRNGNAKDASGKRTSHKAGKAGKGMLGALVVKGVNGTFKGAQFNIGTGFTEQQRKDLWGQNPIGFIIKYKYFASGAKDAPRFPVFLGFRDKRDMPQQ
jgi:DNA ligase-1